MDLVLLAFQDIATRVFFNRTCRLRETVMAVILVAATECRFKLNRRCDLEVIESCLILGHAPAPRSSTVWRIGVPSVGGALVDSIVSTMYEHLRHLTACELARHLDRLALPRVDGGCLPVSSAFHHLSAYMGYSMLDFLCSGTS